MRGSMARDLINGPNLNSTIECILVDAYRSTVRGYYPDDDDGLLFINMVVIHDPNHPGRPQYYETENHPSASYGRRGQHNIYPLRRRASTPEVTMPYITPTSHPFAVMRRLGRSIRETAKYSRRANLILYRRYVNDPDEAIRVMHRRFSKFFDRAKEFWTKYAMESYVNTGELPQFGSDDIVDGMVNQMRLKVMKPTRAGLFDLGQELLSELEDSAGRAIYHLAVLNLMDHMGYFESRTFNTKDHMWYIKLSRKGLAQGRQLNGLLQL